MRYHPFRNARLKVLALLLSAVLWFTVAGEPCKHAVGDQFGHARATLVARCQPMVTQAYEDLAGVSSPVALEYEPEWRRAGLVAALAASRDADVRRGVSTVGPHRDDVAIMLGGMPARTHASQGEQRTLALALRLAAHRLVAERTG